MNNRSLAFQLGIYILTTITIVISVVIFLNFNFSEDVLIQKIEESATLQSGHITNQIGRNVYSTQEVTRNVAMQLSYYEEHGDVEYFLTQVLTHNLNISGFHIELFENTESKYLSVVRTKDEDFLISNDAEHCLINTQYDVDYNPTGLWSDPFYNSNHLAITYTQAIRSKGGGFVGVISSQIDLDFLSALSISNDQYEDQFVYIVEADGTFLTHSEADWVMNRSIFEADSHIFPENSIELESLRDTHGAISGFASPKIYNHERTWIHFSPIAYTEWFVVILIPSKELFKDLHEILRDVIIVSFVGLLLILVIITLIFRKKLSPLSNVVKSIQYFSFGDKRKSSNKNEIELLADSLDELQEQYSLHLQEQNQSRKDRRKYEKDLKSAKEIQTAIIPNENPPFPNNPEIELFAALKPAESIGGDLYDYFFIDSNHLLFTMGDVSGKGIPAALFMAVAHTMIKSKATILSAKHIVEQVNNELSYQNYNQHFLTLFLGILDLETGVLSYCNAAHNYPFLVKKNKDVQLLEKTHGLPLGVYSNKSYPGDSVVLREGDMLVLYTDGVTDCIDDNDSFYGMDRLNENIVNLAELPATELVGGLLDSLKIFRGKTRQVDDISIMALRYNGRKQESL